MYPVTRAKGSSLPEIAAGLSYALKWGSNSLVRAQTTRQACEYRRSKTSPARVLALVFIDN